MRQATGIIVAIGLLGPAARGLYAQFDWGVDQLVATGEIGRLGVAADRTPGNDTVFLGVVQASSQADTIRVFRTTDRGQSWTELWKEKTPGRRIENLRLKVLTGIEQWVCLFWILRDSFNNGDIAGVRVALDGSVIEPFYPTRPGDPDTIAWLAVARSFTQPTVVDIFWQDEVGLVGQSRRPVIRHSMSTDYGRTWTGAQTLLEGFETPASDYGAPRHVFVAARSLERRDIGVVRTTDGGQSWDFRWVSIDTTRYEDMFPSVAATHDSAADARIWVSYDSYRPTGGWSVRYAFSSNDGDTWFLNQSLASTIASEYWSVLDCAGFGSRRVRVAYLSNERGRFDVVYRTCDGIRPTRWSVPIAVSDREVSNAVPPVVTNFGTADDSLNQGLVFFSDPGPRNVWCDAYQFIGAVEDEDHASTTVRGGQGVRCRFVPPGRLLVQFELEEGGWTWLEVTSASGRHLHRVPLGFLAAGSHEVDVPMPNISRGAYFLQIRNQASRMAGRGILVR
ncbi:MAG: hypothetical protein ABIK62_04135 [candidate division WOR-3 bacterium]